MSSVGIIIVNWNSSALTRQAIDSFIRTHDIVDDLKYEIIIIDNASSIEDYNKLQVYVEDIRKKIKNIDIKIIRNSENLGFGKACNMGACLSKAKYLCFVNPDIIFIEEVIPELIKILENDKSIGIIGPRILNINKQEEFSPAKKPNLFNYIIGGKLFLPLCKLLNFDICGRIYLNLNKILYPDWILGAFLLTENKRFKKLGGFDDAIFMYYDEIDLCLRYKREGYKICYYPKVSVMHIGGGTTRKLPARLILKKHIDSEIYFFQKWYGVKYTLIHLLINTIASFLKFIILYPISKVSTGLKLKALIHLNYSYLRFRKLILLILRKK